MPVFDPTEVIQRAQRNLQSGSYAPGAPSTPPEDPRIAALDVLAPGMPKPKPQPKAPGDPRIVQMQKDVAPFTQPQQSQTPPPPTSPVHDRLRATPGTLEHLMQGLDRHYGDDAKYQSVRDFVKYRLQAQIGAGEKMGLPVLTKKDAIDEVEVALKGVGAGKTSQQLHPELWLKQDPPEDNSIVGTWNSLKDENPIIRALKTAATIATPDYTPQIETATHNAASAAFGQGIPAADIEGHGLGKVLHGFMGVFNPGTWASSLLLPGQVIADQLVVPRGQQAPDIASQIGLDHPADFVDELIGGLLGAKMVVHSGPWSGKAPAPVETATPVELTGDATAPPRKGTPAPASDPVALLPKAEAEPAAVETPATKPRKGAPSTDQAPSMAQSAVADTPGSPTKGAKRPLLQQAIDEATKPAEDTTPALGVKVGDTSAQHPRGGEWHPMETRVVPLDDLNVSHDHNTFEQNPLYPQDLQPRDRSGTGLKEQVLENAAKLDKNGEISTDFHSTDRGAPVVGQDGVVEAGNGRVMSMRNARDAGNQAWLDYQAKVRSMHPEETVGMKDPVLVRVRTSDLNPEQRVQFANDANGRAAAASTRVESATTEASALDGHTIDGLVDTGTDIGDALKSPQNHEAVQRFIDGMDPADARALAHDQVGLLDRMKNAALARILGPGASDVLGRIVQDGEIGRRIKSGIERAAVPLLKAIRATETGAVSPNLDFRGALSDAMRVVDDYRASDNKAGFWDQGRIDAPDPNAMRIAKALVEAKSQAQVEGVLHGIADRVTGATDGGLFSDGPAPARSLDDVLSHLEEPKGAGMVRVEETPSLESQGRFAGDQRIVRPGREAAGTDVRLLAAAGAVGLGAAGAIVYRDALQKWYERHGMEGVVAAGTAGLAILGGIYAASKGAKLGTGTFDVGGFTLDPRSLTQAALKGKDNLLHLFGEAGDAITSAKAEHTFRSADALQRLGKAGADAFGDPKFLQTDAFKAMNDKVRDIMEQNIADGRDWHEGLTPEWQKFVEGARSIMDEVLNEAEKEGIRVRVTNDGTQSGKIQPGASIKLKGGRTGKYLGPEAFGEDVAQRFRAENVAAGRDPEHGLAPSKVEGDPFTDAGSPNDANATTRRMRELINRKGAEPGPKENLLVEVEGPNGPEVVRIKPGEAFGRPVDRIGDAYVPRIFKGEFVKQLQNLAAQPAEFKAALSGMLEKLNNGLGLTGDQMMGKLGDIAGGMENSSSDVANFMANLEKERMWDLAKFEWTDAKGNVHVVDPYASSYVDSVSTYLDRAWRRVAIARQFGPDPNALGGVLQIIKGKNPSLGGYLEKLVGRSLGLGPEASQSSAMSAVSRVEGSFQTATKLTAGTTPISQMNDLLYSLTVAGSKKVLGAMYDLLLKPNKGEMRDLADVMSATHQQWLNDLRFGRENGGVPESIGGKLRKGAQQLLTSGERTQGVASIADAVMTGVGLRTFDRMMKRVAAIAGLRDATAALDAAAKLSGAPEGALARKMAFYGLTDDHIAAARTGGADAALRNNPEAMSTVAANIRQKLMYSGAVEDLPLWTSTPVGSIMARFKKPAYVSTRFLLNDVLGEASKGNMVPLTRFVGHGVLLGAGATYLKDLVRLDGMDDETRKLWRSGDYGGAIERFFAVPGGKTIPAQLMAMATDPKKGKTLTDLLGAATQNIYDAGGLGLPGDVMPQLNRRVSDVTGNPAPNPWEAAMPTSAAEIYEFGRRILGAEQKTSKYAQKVDVPNPSHAINQAIGDFGHEQRGAAWFEQMRATLPIAKRITDLFDLKPDLVRLRDLERKDRSSGPLKPAEYAEMAKLTASVEGRFSELANEVKEAKGDEPTLKRETFDAAGITEGGALVKKRKGAKE